MTVLLTFFILSYLLTWGIWLAAGAVTAPGLRGLLFLLGTFTPGFVALGLTARATGRGGVAALLRRLIDWEYPARWFVFAISYFALIKLAVAVMHRVITGAWPAFGELPWYLMLAATLFSTVIGGQSGEEIGWRGYALPRLSARFGLGGASLLLGVVWACWHLPLFFIDGTSTTGQSFPLYLLSVTAISVALTWLYMNTGGSLLPVMLMHAAVNNTKDIVPSAEPGAMHPWGLSRSLPAWLTVLVLWLCAGWFLLKLRGRSLASGRDNTPPTGSDRPLASRLLKPYETIDLPAAYTSHDSGCESWPARQIP